jgi:4-hydroxybenzoate polyprenyltransferase
MERFPALRLILHHGRLISLWVAVVVTALLVMLAWFSIWALALLIAPVSFLFFYFLMKSYVELIQIVVEMVH